MHIAPGVTFSPNGLMAAGCLQTHSDAFSFSRTHLLGRQKITGPGSRQDSKGPPEPRPSHHTHTHQIPSRISPCTGRSSADNLPYFRFVYLPKQLYIRERKPPLRCTKNTSPTLHQPPITVGEAAPSSNLDTPTTNRRKPTNSQRKKKMEGKKN